MLDGDADDDGERGGGEPLAEPHGPGLERSRGDRRGEGDDAGRDLPPPGDRRKRGGALHGLADVPEIVEGAGVEGGRGHGSHHATDAAAFASTLHHKDCYVQLAESEAQGASTARLVVADAHEQLLETGKLERLLDDRALGFREKARGVGRRDVSSGKEESMHEIRALRRAARYSSAPGEMRHAQIAHHHIVAARIGMEKDARARPGRPRPLPLPNRDE